MNLLEGNLLEPLSWNDLGPAQNFTKNHRCYCGASLLATYFYHRYYVECPEHGKAFGHSVIHRSQAEKITNDERTGMYELNKGKHSGMSEQELIDSLY